MIPADQLLTFMADGSNIVLLLVLIALFIIAYKILQVVVQTMIITVLSGVFVAVLSYLGLGPDITIRTIFTFMSLGITLFIGFSLLDTATNILSIVYKALKEILGGILTIIGKIKGLIFSEDDGPTPNNHGSSSSSSESSSKEKSIILEEADDE